MSYSVQKLVAESYYISNIVSREFETVSGQQSTDGVSILNDLIADKTIEEQYIPYAQEHTMTALQGVSEYFIADLIGVNTYTFFIDSVRYQTVNQQREQFFGSGRNVNITSLPFIWHSERELGGSRLFVFPIPSQNFPVVIWGQFSLSSVTQFQDLELTLDRFYINFLKYELAVRLCNEYGYNVPPRVEKQLQTYYQVIGSQSNTMDLRQKTLSTLGNTQGINWAYINLGQGYTPW